jgi:ATP-dependent RNA helicase DeaD
MTVPAVVIEVIEVGEVEIINSIELADFSQLELKEEILSALSFLGYEKPTPIQSASIPCLLSNKDVLAQAQTGTGKTAAFALPILSKLDLKLLKPQAVVIVPTRELSIQVAEAFQSYSKNLKDFHVTPIYGGQEYRVQLRSLKRGTHVVVATPGRLMDHLRRGSLWVGDIKTVVLDEADEMLKMGFLEDVEWILEQMTHQHQTALFSATMPQSIVKISSQYLSNPEHISITPTVNKVDTIDQEYVQVKRAAKLDTLTRFLEVEDLEAALIFVRTRTMSSELSERLQARGYAAAALNGDMSQSLREKVIARLKKGTLDLVVATDVAARGIDVERIGLVVNYDIPYDTESYIHRVGRTGRAGRKGRALLLVTQREHYLLKSLQKAMNQSIVQVFPPSRTELLQKRDERLLKLIVSVMGKSKKLDSYRALLTQIIEQEQCGPDDVAIALMSLLQKQGRSSAVEQVEELREPAQGKAKSGRSLSRNGSGNRDLPFRQKSSSSKSKYKRKGKFEKKTQSGSKGKGRPAVDSNEKKSSSSKSSARNADSRKKVSRDKQKKRT